MRYGSLLPFHLAPHDFNYISLSQCANLDERSSYTQTQHHHLATLRPIFYLPCPNLSLNGTILTILSISISSISSSQPKTLEASLEFKIVYYVSLLPTTFIFLLQLYRWFYRLAIAPWVRELYLEKRIGKFAISRMDFWWDKYILGEGGQQSVRIWQRVLMALNVSLIGIRAYKKG